MTLLPVAPMKIFWMIAGPSGAGYIVPPLAPHLDAYTKETTRVCEQAGIYVVTTYVAAPPAWVLRTLANHHGEIKGYLAGYAVVTRAPAQLIQGIPINAIDLFPEMIANSQQNASRVGVQVRFKTAGLGEMAHSFGQDQFDLLFCLGNSLPYLISEQELIASLQDFSVTLRPGGMLFIQNRNFEVVMQRQERWMEPQIYQSDGDEWIFQRFYDFLPDGLIHFNIVSLRRMTDFDWESAVNSTLLSPQISTELDQHLFQAGFREITAYRSMQGESFSPD